MNRKNTIFLQALLVAVLAVPFAGCEEDVFEYNTAKLYAVDPALISHREVAVWKTSVPSPAFLAALPDGRVAVAGGKQGVVLATNGVVLARFAWQDAAAATAIGVAPDGRIFVGAKDRVVVCSSTGGAPMTVWNSLSASAISTSSSIIKIGFILFRSCLYYLRQGNLKLCSGPGHAHNLYASFMGRYYPRRYR